MLLNGQDGEKLVSPQKFNRHIADSNRICFPRPAGQEPVVTENTVHAEISGSRPVAAAAPETHSA